MEILATNTRTYNKDDPDCREQKMDIMISVSHARSTGIFDIFLTQEDVWSKSK